MEQPSLSIEYSLDDYSLPLKDCTDGTKTEKLRTIVNSYCKSRKRHWKSSGYQKYPSALEQRSDDSAIEDVDDFDDLTDSIHLARQRFGIHEDFHDAIKHETYLVKKSLCDMASMHAKHKDEMSQKNNKSDHANQSSFHQMRAKAA
jgi:hypothetical protein